ncbi:ankyrin repeat domain-containing protein [Legionella drancourtii]|uniref:Uncharacterized protein n=1 Tax=Legionella drancourtii LLAP12 TaxID=658187 RepID=G9EMF2_9GAMM|nr:ankyrin repeat domain-containing protein [Legionella drancourtii]EHL31488.1 hypothetical protein LDG_6418 [Legionella drancourtii LLAP12]
MKHTKQAYSCYFEVQLYEEDFGKSREKHNQICNELLLQQLEQLSQEGIQFCNEITNEKLMSNISSNMQAAPDAFFVWEHCSSSTAMGQKGIMRLIPKSQHTNSSEFWGIIHPDYRKRGGYHEWAVPFGAPIELLRADSTKLKDIDLKKISDATIESLPNYFKKAVLSNNLTSVAQLINHAKQIDCSLSKLKEILNQTYTIGAREKKTTLLHIASKSGNEPLMNILIKYTDIQPHFTQTVDHKLETPAHIAVYNNRPLLLKKLILAGADLSKKNHKQETVHDMITRLRFHSCKKVYDDALQIITSHSNISHDDTSNTPPKDKTKTNIPYRDPTMVYGNQPSTSKQSSSSGSTQSSPPVFNGNYTFQDVLKKQFEKTTASHFIKKAEVQRPVPKTTFVDLLKKQFGEQNKCHFTTKAFVHQSKHGQDKPIFAPRSPIFWNERNKRLILLKQIQVQQEQQAIKAQEPSQTKQLRPVQPTLRPSQPTPRPSQPTPRPSQPTPRPNTQQAREARQQQTLQKMQERTNQATQRVQQIQKCQEQSKQRDQQRAQIVEQKIQERAKQERVRQQGFQQIQQRVNQERARQLNPQPQTRNQQPRSNRNAPPPPRVNRPPPPPPPRVIRR